MKPPAVPFGDALQATTTTPHTTAFGLALPHIDTEPAISPWTPRRDDGLAARDAELAAQAARADELAELRSRARDDGLAAGLAETALLREQLARVVAAVEQARREAVELAAPRVAELAAAVVEGWLAATDARALIEPIVNAWLREANHAAVASCHPATAPALREAIGDAAVTVEEDSSLAPNDVIIRGADRGLDHRWAARLGELRSAIVGELMTRRDRR